MASGRSRPVGASILRDGRRSRRCRSRHRASTWFVAALAWALPHAAWAETPAVADPIAPPTLPSLTHRDFTLGYQFTGAGIGEEPRTAKGSSEIAYAWFSHLDVEYPVTPRKWFFGAAWDLASGAAPKIGTQLLYGNPELWLRGVWSNRSGLSAGGSLGLVLPLPRELTSKGRAVLETIRVVRPWDSSYFAESTLTARPALDMRLMADPFLFQLRQGLDWSYSFIDGRSDIQARMSAYVGVDLARTIGLGLELFEVYPITAILPDDKRAAFTFSPSVRFRLPRVEPGLSALLPFNTPLGGTASSFFAFRVHLTVTLEPFPEPDGGAKSKSKAAAPSPLSSPPPPARGASLFF